MTTRRDAIARQTSAWLFTMSEDENRVIARIVERVRAATPQYGPLNVRTDKRDWNGETADELTDALFYLCAEQVKRHLARVDAIDSAPARTVAPASDTGLVRDANGSPIAGGGTFCGGSLSADCMASRERPCDAAPAGSHEAGTFSPTSSKKDTGCDSGDAVNITNPPSVPSAPAHPSNGSHRVGGGITARSCQSDIGTGCYAAHGAHIVCHCECHMRACLRELAAAPVQVAAPGVADDHTLWSADMDGRFDDSEGDK